VAEILLPIPRKNAPSIVAILSDLDGDEFRIGQEACPINALANLALQCIGESPQVALPRLVTMQLERCQKTGFQ